MSPRKAVLWPHLTAPQQASVTSVKIGVAHARLLHESELYDPINRHEWVLSDPPGKAKRLILDNRISENLSLFSSPMTDFLFPVGPTREAVGTRNFISQQNVDAAANVNFYAWK